MTNTEKPDLRIVAGSDISDSDVPVDVLDEEDGLGDLVFVPSGDRLWYGFNEFKDIDKVREYIIRGWLIAHNVTSFLASRGTGKSTIALDLGCHLACDMSWWGTPAMTGWKVIYICGEDDEGMILNCRAWAQHHGRAPTDDRFMIARGIIKMTNRLELEHRLKEMVEWANGGRCLVILDTWQRAIAGTGSSNEEAMEIAVENAETLAQALNGPMIICHHPPKDARVLTIKGSGVQEDTSSGIWTLKKVEDGILVTITRAKGSGEENWRKFRFKKITLPGEDAFGDPLEGIVPIQVSGEKESNSHWLAHQEAAGARIENEQTAYAYQIWRIVAKDHKKDWTVADMAEKLAGLSIGSGPDIVTIPHGGAGRRKLDSLFMHPVRLSDEGVTVKLVDTGEKGPGGAAVRVFRVENTALDTGESTELPDTLG